MTEPPTVAQQTLRGDILAYGESDWVSLADIRGALDRRGLAPTAAERQQLILSTIRSMLVDGLIEVGEIPGRNDSRFLTWHGGIDSVMRQLADRVIGQWDNPGVWEYTTWLNLTPAGEAAAQLVPPEA